MYFLLWIIEYFKNNKASSIVLIIFLTSLGISKYSRIVGKKIVQNYAKPIIIENAILKDINLEGGYFICKKGHNKIAVFPYNLKLPTNKYNINEESKIKILEDIFKDKLANRLVVISGYEPQIYGKGSFDIVIEGEIWLGKNQPLSEVDSIQDLSTKIYSKNNLPHYE